MTEYSRFFGGPAGSVPEYTQPQFAEVLKRIFSNGVFYSVDNQLQVTETDPVSLAVRIGTGEAWINGFWYQNDAALTNTLETADTTYDRIDRIILRLDTVTNYKISCEVLTGTPAASPVAPSLTQNANIYEISLAQVLVNAGATSVSNAKITDERTFVLPNEGVGNIGDQTISGVKTFTNFPVTPSSAPTSDYQVANKKYVDDNQQVTLTNTVTLTNKRITPRVGSATSSSSLTIDSDSYDIYCITALAEAMTINAPSGTPTQGQKLLIRIKDNATARALSWNAIYRVGDIALPTTTVPGKTMYLGFIYNSTDAKWDFIAYGNNY